MEIRTKADYDELIEQLTKNVESYEEHYANGNRYLLYLANGDAVSFEFNEGCVAHLLGVDTSFLSQYAPRSKNNSYDTLKYLLENSYSIYKNIDRLKAMNTVFSKYVYDKVEFFDKQIEPPYPNSVSFVCKYDTEKTYMSKPVDGIRAGYLIGRTTNDGDLLLLGLVKDEKYPDSNKYWIQTSRIIRNDEYFNDKLSDILHNQEITYIRGCTIENRYKEYSKTINLNSVEINSALESLNSYSSMTGAIPNTIAGHKYNIGTLLKEKKKHYIMSRISGDVDSKTTVVMSDEEKNMLDPLVIKLVDKYNDYAVATGNIDSLTNGTFSEIKDERDALRQELEQIKKLLADMDEANKRLEKINQKQASRLNSYDELADRFINASEELKVLKRNKIEED